MTIRTAWDSARRGGRTTVVGIGAKDQQVSFNALEIFHWGRTPSGCVCGNSDPARTFRSSPSTYGRGAWTSARW